MTIEAQLQTTNELLGKILAHLAAPQVIAVSQAPNPVTTEVQAKPKAETPKPAPKAPEKAATPPPAAPQANTGPTYDDVKKAAIALAKAKPGGNAVTTLLADAFGVDHASKLKSEQWAEFIAKAQEAAK